MKRVIIFIFLYGFTHTSGVYGEDNFLENSLKNFKSGPVSVHKSCSKARGKTKNQFTQCLPTPAAFIDGSKLRDVNLKVSIVNDAFPHLLGLQPDYILKNGVNDMGLTHGFAFSSAVKINGWDVIQVKVDKKLFTGHDSEKNQLKWNRWQAGIRTRENDPFNIREQLFTEEATYTIRWRHFLRDGSLYFDVGVGLQDLNRTENNGVLNTAEQQTSWHRSRGYKPINNNPTKNTSQLAEGIAMIMELAIGKVLTETFLKNKWIHCTGDVDLNAFSVLSGNKGSSLVGTRSTMRFEVGSIGHFINRFMLTIFGQISGEILVHGNGAQFSVEPTLGVDIFEVLSVGYRQKFYNGNLVNYQTHNTLGEKDNGRTGEIFLQLNFNTN